MRKAVQHLRRADTVMGTIIEQVGPYRIKYTEPTFHSLAKSIVYQQLSGYAAATIFGRLVAATGDPVTPAAVLRLSMPERRAFGLSQQKASYVADLALKTSRREIDFAGLSELADEQVIEQLTLVKGIGIWTAHMFLIFALRRPDVLPVSDLGVRTAIRKAYNLPEPPTTAEILLFGEKWRPYCSVASWYLWRSLELSGRRVELPAG
ncbi:MAG: DNA-3-methyladenine glycosylase family protein [Bryobacteraceae bacterium]